MLLPLIALGSAALALFVIGALRRAGTADDASDQLIRQLANAEHVHCAKMCGCRGGADTGLPFEHRGVGNRGRLNHREAE